MTTVAYRDGVMAADSCEVWGSLKIANSQKLYRAGRYVIGIAGDSAATDAFVKWIRSGQKKALKPKLKKDQELFALVAGPDGLTFWDDKLTPDPIHAPFFAIGTGLKYAMGAMAHGADAIAAVTAAISLDRNSDFPVVSEKVKGRRFV